MVMSHIIKGKDGKHHLITPTITKATLNFVKRMGCTEVAIRSSESIPEHRAKLVMVDEIIPVSLANRQLCL